MARINTNIPSLIAQNNLSRANRDLALRLTRLSTGLRINRGADDPAGLIVSERLRSEREGLRQAIDNSERASSVIATTEAHLAEVNDLLSSIRSLIVESASTGGLSDEEIEANQLQVDSAIDSITRISNTASFAGLQLLDGSLSYLTSGVATSAIAGVDIFAAQFGNNPSISIDVEVVASAQAGQLTLSGTAAGAITSTVTVEVAGTRGVQTLSFVSGTSMTDVAAAINTIRETTGVSATLITPGDDTSGIVFSSIEFGSDAFVSVRKIGAGGDFFRTYDVDDVLTQRDEGLDVTAIINGALAIGDGTDITLNTPSLSVDMTLTRAFAQTAGTQKTFEIIGGGADFQLGPTISTAQLVGFGIGSVAASRLGGTLISDVRYHLDSLKTGGTNSLVAGEAQNASIVLDASIKEVSVLRGRIGAFERNTLQTNIRSLQIGFENIAASESRIRDTDFAEETAALTRAQILSQAGTSVLGTANLISQNVLSLLG
ncbi:MAG: flagellin [Phycisphaerales bacterium]|nr:flagellin [Phycisphaerales bacterium]NNM25007.1 flagellin [Phycisphaerales bacterium]